MSLNPSDLTPRQRLLLPYLQQSDDDLWVASKVGLPVSSVASARKEIRSLQAIGGRRSLEEQNQRSKEIEADLASGGRCGVCHLLEPHVCIDRKTTRTGSARP